MAIRDHVLLRTDSKKEFKVKLGPELQRIAMRWSYIARYRRRWRGKSSLVDEHGERLRKELEGVGLKRADLQAIANAAIVEVRVPYETEKVAWEGRVLPWEYVISSATSAYRDEPLTIVRHLDTGRKATKRANEPLTLCYVETTPGDLRKRFEFTAERRLVHAWLLRDRVTKLTPTLDDPSERRLGAEIARRSPSVVHVAGVDNHQAANLLGVEDSEGSTRIPDGLPMSIKTHDRVRYVGAQKIAQLLTRGEKKPLLVGFNVYNSAARLAALTVAEGAQLSLGFQDTLDDALAELFFAEFYGAWSRSHSSQPLLAFESAWASMRALNLDIRGSGIVLWSESSVLDTLADPAKARETAEMHRAVISDLAKETAAESPTPVPMRDCVEVQIAPFGELNYSMLHNNRDLFETFVIAKLVDVPLPDARVRVDLNVGSESFPYRASFALDTPVTRVREKVRVPLTAALMRSVDERMHTTLFVEVVVGTEVVYQQTHRISLQPIDEWRDNKSDGRWLPSFVLPRDPAVLRIVDLAQRYLVALKDDPGAGFDGYQSVDEENGDFTSIDQQVSAIWWAILHDVKLSYINPPPSYAESAQRLRTPSQVVDGGRGTCIDLALLFAACLEYVEIYPVVFLFTGHACPGYWRSESAHDAFREVSASEPSLKDRNDAANSPGASGEPRESYIAYVDAFEEISRQIRDQNLVPVETVGLTWQESFGDARAESLDNFKKKSEFDSMLDILLAREAGITPLPVLGREAHS